MPHPSPMEPTDAALVRDLQREVERRAEGRPDLVPFVAWLRTRLDLLAAELTPPQRSRVAKRRVDSRPLN